MQERYTPKQIEQKWIEKWQKNGTYNNAIVKDKDNKMYVLVMFPYPSGSGLHTGHARVYVGTDVLARFFRMQGKDMIFPMGWDAFGLPAENAAIKEKKNPIDMVPQNIKNFKRQMNELGLSFDWSREISTTDPSYYKWTQWLFIQFFKMGLLYKQNMQVYFCEFCKTGLAEEEVLPSGLHERCGKPIIRKNLPQWVFKITAYADRLASDLKDLDWPEGILEMQKKWIGKQEGMVLDFKIEGTQDILNVWTTRSETLFGVSFLVVAPEHPFVQKLQKEQNLSSEVTSYIVSSLAKTDQQRQKDEKEKTGVFTGSYAIHPMTGKKIPIWIADYVLSSVGTGAVMGVPADDTRDGEFAKKYNLPFIEVISDTGTLVHSDSFSGMNQKEAKEKIGTYLEKENIGNKKTQYHLRDWIFSRQRYWGEPIPMVYCETCAKRGKSYFTDQKNISEYNETISKDESKPFYLNEKEVSSMCGWYPLFEKDLPLELPYVKSYQPDAQGRSPLANISDFVKAKCPSCGSEAVRETDTMPNWAGSCWYFLRFADPHNTTEAWSTEKLNNQLPVDWYVGGAEHAVLHLLYSRFWVKALYDLKLLGFTEPFLRLRNVGMVLAEDHKKMSKSLGNVINPDDVIAEFGADALRVYALFMAPFNAENAWSTAALQGSYRFLTRIWQFYNSSDKITNDVHKEDVQLVAELQKVIGQITSGIPNVKYNTCISALMTFLNKWEDGKMLSEQSAKVFLQLLSPFTPFMSEELWHERFHEEKSIHLSRFPEIQTHKLIRQNSTLAIQVDGKFRSLLNVKLDLSQEEGEKLALQDQKIQKYIKGKTYTIIFIPNKVINFIVNS